MSLKKFFFVLTAIAVVSLGFISCQERKPMTFQKVSSQDNSYSLEIPTGLSEHYRLNDLLGYIGNQSTFATVKALKPGETLQDYSEKGRNETFDYSTISDTPTELKFKITRGANYWSAYEFLGLKELNGIQYVISLKSDTYDRQQMDEAFNHMMSSFQ